MLRSNVSASGAVVQEQLGALGRSAQAAVCLVLSTPAAVLWVHADSWGHWASRCALLSAVRWGVIAPLPRPAPFVGPGLEAGAEASACPGFRPSLRAHPAEGAVCPEFQHRTLGAYLDFIVHF